MDAGRVELARATSGLDLDAFESTLERPSPFRDPHFRPRG
jgi:hypothetical protein